MGDSIPLVKSHLAKFPFLPQAKQYIGELDITFSELAPHKAIMDRAKQRIMASFIFDPRADRASKQLDVEITSFPIAILLVTGVNDNTLTKRYALFEAKKIYSYLEKERDEIIFEIAHSFKWDISGPFIIKLMSDDELGISVKKFRIHFVNYVDNVGSLAHDLHWKLVNHQLENGQVEVTKREVCRLLQEEIREYIENRSVGKLPQIPQIVQDMIEEVKSEYLKIKPNITEFDKMRELAEEDEYPPCIQNLYDRMIKGQHLSHIERFTLVTYLLRQGISVDAITNLFASLSDYRSDKTRYQVEHLAGKKGSGTVYNPPNCATLRTHGVCINPDDPICKTIKNPLTYHLRKKPVHKKEQ